MIKELVEGFNKIRKPLFTGYCALFTLWLFHGNRTADNVGLGDELGSRMKFMWDEVPDSTRTALVAFTAVIIGGFIDTLLKMAVEWCHYWATAQLQQFAPIGRPDGAPTKQLKLAMWTLRALSRSGRYRSEMPSESDFRIHIATRLTIPLLALLLKGAGWEYGLGFIVILALLGETELRQVIAERAQRDRRTNVRIVGGRTSEYWNKGQMAELHSYVEAVFSDPVRREMLLEHIEKLRLRLKIIPHEIQRIERTGSKADFESGDTNKATTDLEYKGRDLDELIEYLDMLTPHKYLSAASPLRTASQDDRPTQ